MKKYLLKQFNNHVEKNLLFKKEDHLLLGISGGADSVALAHLLYRLGYNFTLAHCNFCLRGNEAEDDQLFVEYFAKQLNVPLHKIKFDTLEISKIQKLSVEDTARKLRYAWFNELIKKHQYSFLLTAHHANDNAETVFMKLTAGTGIRGLVGINQKRGNIVRPLLFAQKKDIIDYCMHNDLEYKIDSSNKNTAYTRNKFRANIIPLLEEVNPNLIKTISHTIDIFKDIEKIYDRAIQNAHQNCCSYNEDIFQIKIKELQNTEAPNTYLYEFLRPYKFSVSDCKNIYESLKGHSGKLFYSQSYELLKDRENLLIRKKQIELKKTYTLNSPDDFENENLPFYFQLKAHDPKLPIEKSTKIALLDFDKISFPIQIRKPKKGDYFTPLGMNKKQLISTFFINNKFNIFQKQNTYLVLSNQTIIWVAEQRINNGYKISEKTKTILQIEKK